MYSGTNYFMWEHTFFSNVLSAPKHASETAFSACSQTTTMHSSAISSQDIIAYLPKKKPNHFITDMLHWNMSSQEQLWVLLFFCTCHIRGHGNVTRKCPICGWSANALSYIVKMRNQPRERPNFAYRKSCAGFPTSESFVLRTVKGRAI